MTDEELGHLFGLFRPRIIEDLSSNGIPTSVSGAILNWYDVRQPDYLLRVDAWKQLLCRGAGLTSEFPRAMLEWKLLRETPYHTVVINDDNGWAIGHIHQVVNLFYKAHASPRKETDWDAVKLRLSSPPELSLTERDWRRLRLALRPIDAIPDLDGLGSYGPGITCEGLTPFDRWTRSGWIPPVPPSWYRWNVRDDYVPKVASDIRYTRIAEVPKSLKSNRIISSEPGQSMFAQKAVWAYLDQCIRRYFNNISTLHDQMAHNSLLYDSDYRTIDLSDASDYVSCDLVSRVLPTLWPLLASVRSTHALFPDGTLVPLRTFAPMGSGICFPVLTLVNIAIGKCACRHPFHVYGDDMIVHKDDIIEVTGWMKACGLVINQGKTCYYGQYRESCGVELYDKWDVTPCYVRDSPAQCDWSKLNDIAQKLGDIGWSSTVKSLISEAVRGLNYDLGRRYRYNPRYQRRELLVPTYIRCDREAKVDGYAGLRKWALTRNQSGDEPESLVRTLKGKLKRCLRFRPAYEYPCLVPWLDALAENLTTPVMLRR